MRRSIKMSIKGQNHSVEDLQTVQIGIRGKLGLRMIPAPKKMIKDRTHRTEGLDDFFQCLLPSLNLHR